MSKFCTNVAMLELRGIAKHVPEIQNLFIPCVSKQYAAFLSLINVVYTSWYQKNWLNIQILYRIIDLQQLELLR